MAYTKDKPEMLPKKDSRRVRNQEKTLKQLPIPEPHPEKPPPGVPIPGEPSGGEMGAFKCKICGKTYNSKDELQLHIKLEHK